MKLLIILVYRLSIFIRTITTSKPSRSAKSTRAKWFGFRCGCSYVCSRIANSWRTNPWRSKCLGWNLGGDICSWLLILRCEGTFVTRGWLVLYIARSLVLWCKWTLITRWWPNLGFLDVRSAYYCGCLRDLIWLDRWGECTCKSRLILWLARFRCWRKLQIILTLHYCSLLFWWLLSLRLGYL